MKQVKKPAINEELARKLAEARQVAGVGLPEAAKKIGVVKSTLWSIERGYAAITPERAEVLMQFYRLRACEQVERFAAALQD